MDTFSALIINPIIKDLIDYEPYFRAIVDNNFIEIKNCLIDFISKYNNLTTEQKNLYNFRYEIGLILACIYVDDVDIFEQIFLPAQSYYKRLITEINPLSILSSLKKYKLTNVVLGYYISEILEKNCSEFVISTVLRSEENGILSNDRLIEKVTVTLQSYRHLKRIENLTSSTKMV